MSVNEAVLEKLRKILTLAGDKAAQPGEIEAAMAKAKAIAMQHNIELADVSIADPKAGAKGIDVQQDEELKLGVAFWRKYHNWVFHVCSEVFGVRFITTRKKHGSRVRCSHIYIIGEPTDVAIAKVIFKWLEDFYPKSYHQAVNTHKIPVDNSAAAHGYYRGLTAGILEVNKREEEKILHTPEHNKYAMVVRDKKMAIDRFVQEAFPDLQRHKSRPKTMNEAAASVGYEKGKTINLNQLGGNQTLRSPKPMKHAARTR